MHRALALLLLVLSSGCAATRGHLIDGPATLTKEATPTCADVVIRRDALASRWGEFLRVRLDETSAVIVGQARLKVGGKVEKEKAFFVSGKDLVLELRWANEKVEVASALPRGTQLELSLRDLTAAAGRCENVRFIVEQGTVVPDIEESAWIAQRTTVHPERSPTVNPERSRGKENDWLAWVGKNADFDTGEWKPWPLASKLVAPRVGTPLSKGIWLALSTQPETARRHANALARKYALPAPDSPEQLSALVDRVRSLSRTDGDAVHALFGGQNEATDLALALSTAFTLAWPVPDLTEVTSPFGMRNHPILKGERLHTGIDLSVPEGTPIIAAGPGVVLRAGETRVNGRFLIIDHGHGVTTAYLHNAKVLVSEGQRVTAGTFVSLSGNTGRSTGPHLHYQLELSQQPVDPLFFRAAPRSLAHK
ncbi:MAG: M23 family metallopeptidase [Archangium sp.]|nr:M23 family metallopeptidase [Archangium sp.]